MTNATNTAQLRASTAKRNHGYSAAVRDTKGKVVAQCIHDHQNRDDNRWLSPALSYKDFPNMLSAFNCAKSLLKIVNEHEHHEHGD